MYSPEQRLKAIELYIKYDFYAAAVIRELGYPSETRTLKSWYLQYSQDGVLKTSKDSYGKYTDEEKLLFWLQVLASALLRLRLILISH